MQNINYFFITLTAKKQQSNFTGHVMAYIQTWQFGNITVRVKGIESFQYFVDNDVQYPQGALKSKFGLYLLNKNRAGPKRAKNALPSKIGLRGVKDDNILLPIMFTTFRELKLQVWLKFIG